MWWLIEKKVQTLEPSNAPAPRTTKATPANDEVKELDAKMSVLELNTKAIEECLNVLQTANYLVEHECARLRTEVQEKTDRLSKAEEEATKNEEALSTAHTEVKQTELAAATT